MAVSTASVFDLLGQAGDEEDIDISRLQLPRQEKEERPAPRPAPRRAAPAPAPAPPAHPHPPVVNLPPETFKYTRMCKALLETGRCHGNDCWFAHSMDEMKANRARVARRIAEERARLGWVDTRQQHKHAQPSGQQRAPSGMFPIRMKNYKTQLCRNWQRRGACQFGDSCNFAHGQNELRQPAAEHSSADPSTNSPSRGPSSPTYIHPGLGVDAELASGADWPSSATIGSSAAVAAHVELGAKQMDAAQLEQLMHGFDLEDDEIEAFICPITHERMRDPVVAADGNSYERKAIESWLSRNSTSPLTNMELPDKVLIPNLTLRKAMRALLGDAALV